MSNEDPLKRFRELLSVSPEDRATHELRILEGLFVRHGLRSVAGAEHGARHDRGCLRAGGTAMTTANLAAIAELDRRAEALARAITLHHNARAATIECSCFHSARGDDDATSDLDAAAQSSMALLKTLALEYAQACTDLSHALASLSNDPAPADGYPSSQPA